METREVYTSRRTAVAAAVPSTSPAFPSRVSPNNDRGCPVNAPFDLTALSPLSILLESIRQISPTKVHVNCVRAFNRVFQNNKI